MTPQKAHKESRLAWLMDKSIPLPGGVRIGLDGIIGLIPGVGDAATSAISSWFIYQGYRKGVPTSVLVRMALNILIDTILGSVPIVGDIFDLFFKANTRNSQLLARYENNPVKTRKQSKLVLAFAILLFIATLWVFIVITVAVAKLLFERLFAY